MSEQLIILYIEEAQLIAQKTNNYSLYLAKMVNNTFTVIWSARLPKATTNNPSYQYKNTFDISSLSFMVNFTNTPMQEGDITFTSGGKNRPISTGQKTTLNEYGVFTPPINGGVPGDVLINNQLPANPREILLDSKAYCIWVNCSGGMSIGETTMTPKNQFQLWFGPAQATGSLIPGNVSNAYVVTVNDGETKTITYNDSGVWVPGEPAIRLTADQITALHGRVNKAVEMAA
jgi:hypothetical protein